MRAPDWQAAVRRAGLLSSVRAALESWLRSDEGREARAAWEVEAARVAELEGAARRLVARLDDPDAVAVVAVELHVAALAAGDWPAVLVWSDVATAALDVGRDEAHRHRRARLAPGALSHPRRPLDRPAPAALTTAGGAPGATPSPEGSAAGPGGPCGDSGVSGHGAGSPEASQGQMRPNAGRS